MVVDWDAFGVGMSIFIPCLNLEEARREVATQMQRCGYGHVTRHCVENGTTGIRVWRTE